MALEQTANLERMGSPALTVAGSTCEPWMQLLQPVKALDGSQELEWLAQAQAGESVAALWTGQIGLVAPLSYRQFAGFDAVCAAFAAQGCPVRLRRSGGGIVPQGAGILNLSLAYPCADPPGSASTQVYAHLCGLVAQVLAELDIESTTQVVDGSFCDGRFNLAVLQEGRVCKIAGTAQYWRRGATQHAVLAHALLLVDADLAALCEQANQFEAALGNARRYRSDAVVSVAQAWATAHAGQVFQGDLVECVKQQLVYVLNSASENAGASETR